RRPARGLHRSGQAPRHHERGRAPAGHRPDPGQGLIAAFNVCCGRVAGLVPATGVSRLRATTVMGTSHMSKSVTIGLVVPFAEDTVPPEGQQMYPDMTFVPRGVGVRSLTPEGFAAAFDAIPAAADHLVGKGVDAIMVIGTSLTFYRGPQAHDRLLEDLRARTGLPVSTMSQAIVDGLREVGARRVAVATAYSDVINARLKELLAASGIATASLECFDILEFGGPSRKSEADIIALSSDAVAKAPQAQ